MLTPQQVHAIVENHPYHAQRLIKRDHNDTWLYLCQRSTKTAMEAMYQYVNSLEAPVCQCGQACPFLSYFKGYQRHCSNRCAQLDSGVLQKHVETNRKKYGVDYVINHNRTQAHETNQQRYGTPFYTQTRAFKQQSEQTNLAKRGVRHHMQDAISFKNSQQSQLRLKLHTTSDGGVFSCQGYEPRMLDLLVDAGIPSKEITTQIKSIPYIWEEKKRRYFPDIAVPMLNLLIEVKSQYYYERDLDLNLQKQEAAIASGFGHVIVVFELDGRIRAIVGDLPLVLQMRMIPTKADQSSTR